LAEVIIISLRLCKFVDKKTDALVSMMAECGLAISVIVFRHFCTFVP